MMKRRHKLNTSTYARMLRMLAAVPDGVVGYSTRELAEETGFLEQTIRYHVNDMRALRVLYIAGWELDDKGRSNVRLYRFGIDKRDAPKPPPKRHADSCRDYRIRAAQAKVLGLLRLAA